MEDQNPGKWFCANEEVPPETNWYPETGCIVCERSRDVEKVLIVDDNREMRETLKTILSGFAEVVGECEDGTEVLASFGSGNPDWVLMDVAMKEMDGITATKLLLHRFPEARVLIVSNYTDSELIREAELAGSFAFVSKENLMGIRTYFKQDNLTGEKI